MTLMFFAIVVHEIVVLKHTSKGLAEKNYSPFDLNFFCHFILMSSLSGSNDQWPASSKQTTKCQKRHSNWKLNKSFQQFLGM